MFGSVANRTSQAAGHASTFIIAACVVIVWAVTGPLFGYSDTWQLVINTGTTIVTFLMVFLIQNSQNRDSAAIQVKLDELIRAKRTSGPPSNGEHQNAKRRDYLFRKRTDAGREKACDEVRFL